MNDILKLYCKSDCYDHKTLNEIISLTESLPNLLLKNKRSEIESNLDSIKWSYHCLVSHLIHEAILSFNDMEKKHAMFKVLLQFESSIIGTLPETKETFDDYRNRYLLKEPS